MEGAKVKTEDTKQQHNRAQAGAAGAAARLSDARQRDRQAGAGDGPERRQDVHGAGGARPGFPCWGARTGRMSQARRLRSNRPSRESADQDLPEVLRTELGRLTEEEAGKRALDPMFANQVVSGAMALAQESGGEFLEQTWEAVRVALMEATGGKDLTDITGSWRDRNKRFAPPGFKPQQSGGAITPAPAAGAPKSPTSAPAPPPGFKVVN